MPGCRERCRRTSPVLPGTADVTRREHERSQLVPRRRPDAPMLYAIPETAEWIEIYSEGKPPAANSPDIPSPELRQRSIRSSPSPRGAPEPPRLLRGPLGDGRGFFFRTRPRPGSGTRCQEGSTLGSYILTPSMTAGSAPLSSTTRHAAGAYMEASRRHTSVSDYRQVFPHGAGNIAAGGCRSAPRLRRKRSR